MKNKAGISARSRTLPSPAAKRHAARSGLLARVALVSLFFLTLLPTPPAIVPSRALAADGDLVPGFGTDGVVLTDFFGGNDAAQGVAVQRDGKFVVSGFATNGAERQFVLARYLEDGNLDPTFDQDGKVVLDLGSTSEAFKVALQEDRKIVAVGDSRPQNSLEFTVVRLNPADGSLDNSFGDGGIVRIDFGNADRAINLAMDEANIFAAGVVVKSQTDSNFGVVRLNLSNGSLNPAFDGDGKLELDFFGKQDVAQAIKLRGPFSLITERHMIVGGFATNDTPDFAAAAVRYDGSLINSLFNEGKEAVDFSGGIDFGFGLFNQPDGKIGSIGWAGVGGKFDLGITRWDRDGDLDRNFALQGEYTFDASSGENNVAFDGMLFPEIDGTNQTDMTFLTAGTGLNPASGNDDWIITQHENDDTNFFEFTKEASPNPAVRGEVVTYTFTIKNLTDVPATVEVTDVLPLSGAEPDLPDPDWEDTFPSQLSRKLYVYSKPITVPGQETRKITLRVKPTASGVLNNEAILFHELYGEKSEMARVEVAVEVKEPVIIGVMQSGKNGKRLTVTGEFGTSSEPQAACPVILIDGQEQKTKRDAQNPSTVLIAKKGGKQIARGQTVTIKARLCGGIETAGFTYTRE